MCKHKGTFRMSLSMKKDLIAEYKTVISALYPNLKHSSIDEVNLKFGLDSNVI